MTTLPADAAGERALEPHETYVHEHHWRNAQDEAEGCKFGMWLFLSTEVLLFAGFFCAYAAFRMLYYDTWRYASMDYLSWKVGLANTIVLRFSSFTVVMAIRETQLARKGRAAALASPKQYRYRGGGVPGRPDRTGPFGGGSTALL